MRIDINFQSSAQKLKHKAISNSLRKGKTNSPARPTTTQTRPTCAQRAAHAHRLARGGRQPARWRFCRDAPVLPSIHMALFALFL